MLDAAQPLSCPRAPAEATGHAALARRRGEDSSGSRGRHGRRGRRWLLDRPRQLCPGACAFRDWPARSISVRPRDRTLCSACRRASKTLGPQGPLRPPKAMKKGHMAQELDQLCPTNRVDSYLSSSQSPSHLLGPRARPRKSTKHPLVRAGTRGLMATRGGAGLWGPLKGARSLGVAPHRTLGGTAVKGV